MYKLILGLCCAIVISFLWITKSPPTAQTFVYLSYIEISIVFFIIITAVLILLDDPIPRFVQRLKPHKKYKEVILSNGICRAIVTCTETGIFYRTDLVIYITLSDSDPVQVFSVRANVEFTESKFIDIFYIKLRVLHMLIPKLMLLLTDPELDDDVLNELISVNKAFETYLENITYIHATEGD